MRNHKNILPPDVAVDFINSLTGAAILDKDGYYEYVSPSWCDLVGVTAETAMKHRVDEMFPDTNAFECLKTDQIVFSKPVTTAKGETALTTYYPRHDDNGQLIGCYLYVSVRGNEELNLMRSQLTDLTSTVEFFKKELLSERGAKYSLDNIVGNSVPILALKKQIISAAKSNSTVLIEGETGSGKELIAHSIHSLSNRSTNNFVRVNCSAIPEELMESEFFGYAPGAFTGAVKGGKTGRFKLADKGSIFLDEINLMPLSMQPKFLRVLQEREIDPVGGTKSEPIDVRVIAATNLNIEQLVHDHEFRSDLYYRLNVIRIKAPALRERKDDLPLLTEHLISKLNVELGTAIQGVDDSVIDMFMAHDWPGNVRELHNAIESAINVTNGYVLRKNDFNLARKAVANQQYIQQHSSYNLKKLKSEYEKKLIIDVLESTDGNKQKSAKLLGISRTVLYEKLKAYGLE